MKLKFLATALLAAALAGCGSSGDKKKTPTQKEAAVEQWQRTRGAVLGQLAKSQYESGAFDKSRQSVTEALKLDPKNANLHVLSAKLSIELGQLEQAERELALARQLDPKNAEADYLSGVICQRWQRYEQAYECYTRAADKNATEMAYLLARGETLVTLNRIPEAIEALQSGMNYFEHNAVLRQTIGQLQVEIGNYKDGIESLRQASLLSPDDGTIRENLAMAYFQNKQYMQARELYSRILKDEKARERCELWIAFGECQLQSGRASDARASFDKATQLNAASAPAWLSLAKAALQLGDSKRAELALRKALAIDVNSSEAHLMLGYIRLRGNKLPEAMAEFQKASLLDKADPVSLCMIGYALEKSGKPQQAMKYYAQALKIKPGDELATRLMASIDTND